MAWIGTSAYRDLWVALKGASRVVGHPSFPTKFQSRAVVEMITDVFSTLDETFAHESMRTCDIEIAGENGIFGSQGWLDGEGAIATLSALNELADVAYEQGKQDGRILSKLRKSGVALLEETAARIATANNLAASGAMSVITEAIGKLHQLEQVEATRLLDDAVERAEASAVAASTAAGISGDATMASFYAELAADEKSSANNFRRLTVVMAFTAAGATGLFVVGASFGLSWLDIPAGDYVHLVQRAIFVAGVFGLAGYFARQAHHHRSMSNWAAALAVQLKTFDAYVAAVGDTALKDELRKSFATRAFGEHPAMRGEPSVTPSAAAMDTAVDWVAKLAAGVK